MWDFFNFLSGHVPLGNVVTVGSIPPRSLKNGRKKVGKKNRKMKEKHEKEMGHGGKWRRTWQDEEIAGRKRTKAERYAGHRVKQMEKSKELKVNGEQRLMGLGPR